MRHNFKNLKAWQKARALVKAVYEVTHLFPSTEDYGLTSQMRRSAVSIPSNIAEGCGRNTHAQLCHFLNIAVGSSCELETQVILAHDLKLLKEEPFASLTQQIEEVRRIILGFEQAIQSESGHLKEPISTYGEAWSAVGLTSDSEAV